jgi:hypothetical protein
MSCQNTAVDASWKREYREFRRIVQPIRATNKRRFGWKRRRLDVSAAGRSALHDSGGVRAPTVRKNVPRSQIALYNSPGVSRRCVSYGARRREMPRGHPSPATRAHPAPLGWASLCTGISYRFSGITKYMNEASETPLMTSGRPMPAKESTIESLSMDERQSPR